MTKVRHLYQVIIKGYVMEIDGMHYPTFSEIKGAPAGIGVSWRTAGRSWKGYETHEEAERIMQTLLKERSEMVREQLDFIDELLTEQFKRWSWTAKDA